MRKILAALAAAALFCPTPAVAQAFTRGNFGTNSSPAINTQASASRAAATGVTHIATSCSGSITTTAAQTAITLNLRDGATGAGTVLWSETIICAISTPCVLTSPPMNIPGTAGNALTCEWSGIPASGNAESATLVSYDVR